MKVKIIGSGGCVSTPRACCSCRVCKEARVKGVPYARTGCSLFIEDENVLIDTPEDINVSLNHADIRGIDYILYSHVDPDHTMGMRIIEQLRMDWLKESVGESNGNPIVVASLPKVIEDLKEHRIKYGSLLEYYKEYNLIELAGVRGLRVGGIDIRIFPVNEQENVAIFYITDGIRSILYAPCDVKPFPKQEEFYDADVLIIGNTVVDDVLKDGFVLKSDNPLRQELFTMQEIEALKEHYRIKEVIITHIEEDWGKSYEDYLELEKRYENIRFAYNGMEV